MIPSQREYTPCYGANEGFLCQRRVVLVSTTTVVVRHILSTGAGVCGVCKVQVQEELLYVCV